MLTSLEATHRNLKTKAEYSLLTYGRMQARDWFVKEDVDSTTWTSIDLEEVAIYISMDDDKVWVRPRKEFEERFEEI